MSTTKEEAARVCAQAATKKSRDLLTGNNTVLAGGSQQLLSLFDNAHSTIPTRSVTLAEAVEIVRGGSMRTRVAQLRETLTSKGKGVYDVDKRNLPAVSIGGTFSTRKASNCTSHSGLVVLDFDHLGDTLPVVRSAIEDDPSVAAVYTSPSGDGLKAAVRVEVTSTDPDEHRRAWFAAAARIKAVCGVDPDPSGKDLARLCFLSHDPAAFIRTDPKPVPVPAAKVAPMSAPGHTGKASNMVIGDARAYVAKIEGAGEGGGRTNQAFKVAAALVRDFALSDEAALPILADWDATSNHPPIPVTYGPNKLTEIIANARKHGRHNEGQAFDSRRGPSAPLKDEKDTAGGSDIDPPNPAMSIDAASCRRFLESAPKARQYLVNGFLPCLHVGVIAAPGGTGKGYLTLQLALSIAAGVPFLGDARFTVSNPGSVLYLNAEDDEDELHRRFLACMRQVTAALPEPQKRAAVESVCKRFYSPSIAGRFRLELFPDEKRSNRRDLLALAHELPDLRLIIIDPANRIMAGDFNKTEIVTAFIQTLEEIAFTTGATVLLVHHTNKGSASGDRDQKHAAESVLGSQAFTNAARWVTTLRVFDDSMRRKFRFTGPLDKFVSLRIPKANYLPAGMGELHLHRIDDDEQGFGGGPLELVDLEEKRNEVTTADVAKWVNENPGMTFVAAADALKGKIGVGRNRARAAISLAVSDGLVIERPLGKNRKALFPVEGLQDPESGEADE